jgi:hypothetical protein
MCAQFFRYARSFKLNSLLFINGNFGGAHPSKQFRFIGKSISRYM